MTGGDPFIREDIFEILDLLKKYNMTTALSTKKLLTDEEIDKLAQCDHITSLQISLDTLDDSIQEVLIMQKGYATDMVCVIKKLLKKGIKVKVNSVVTRHNIAGIIKLLCFLEQIGVSEYVISPYSANMGRNSTDFHPTYEQYRELFSAVDEMHTSMKIDHPVLEYITLDNNENFYQNKNNVICNAGIDGFIIGTDGSACVCERMAQSGYSLGNIKDMSIMEIWNSPKIENYYNPSIELFKASKCYECEEREYCIKQRGICFVHSYILNGTIYSPDNFCKYNDKSKRIY